MGIASGLADALGSLIEGVAKVTLKIGSSAVEYGAEESIKYAGRKAGRRVIAKVGEQVSDTEENRIRMEYAARIVDASLENVGTQGHQRVIAATMPIQKISKEWKDFETQRLAEKMRKKR